MRLIDADELLQTVSIKSVFGDEINKMKCGELRKILEMIKNAPTVEPQRMRGRWVGVDYDGYTYCNPVYYTWKCSMCNCLVEDEEPTWDYCPNCGADMREE